MVKNNKRFLCFLSCLALILALISPLPVSAAVASDHVTESSGDGYALYNGVKLPNIDSVWTDKESYPYAFIYNADDGTALYILSNPLSFASDVVGTGQISTSFFVYAPSDGVWDELFGDTTTGAEFPASVIAWTSSDIINTTDQSVYLSASDPIPLDGMTVIEWDGDTEGLESYADMYYKLADFAPASNGVGVEVYSGGSVVLDFLLMTQDPDYYGPATSSWSLVVPDSTAGRVISADDVVAAEMGISPGIWGLHGDEEAYVSLLAYTTDETIAPTYLIDGTWQFDPTISGDDFSLAATFSCETANFSGAGITYDSSSQQLTFTGDGMNDVVAWSAASGWLSQDYRSIVLDGEYSLDETAFSWYVSNAVLLQDAAGDVPNYTTVTIGDQSYKFWAYDQDNYFTSPDVTLTVATVGSKMEYGLRSKVWTYSGDSAFQGFASQSDGEVAYFPGSNYTLAGAADQAAAYTLYPVSELPALTTTVFIDGVEHIFTGDSTELSPLVQLIVAEDTITLAGASGTYTFTPPEGNIFLGLAPSSAVAPTYPIGTYTLGQQDTNSVYTLYTVLESLGSLLDTVVIVYSNSGTTLHDSYSTSGYGTAPALTLTILHNGLQISNSDGVVSSWTAADPDFFLGFAMQRNATTPSFRPGQSFTIGGGSTDALTNLYVVYSPGYSDINDFEVSSWLVSAVGGFLDFQLWPGMSLNEVMWIILVAGVLFWFLKLTI